MHTSTLISFAAITALATAAKIEIAVGKDGLVFSPSSVTAAMGDVIEYQFFPPTHSVIMGDFNNPCMPAATGGFFSGGFTTSNGQNSNVFQVTVNTTDPIFFYCGFPTHCESGMSGVINANSSQTLAAYQSKASTVANTVAPSAPFGGQIVPAGSSGGGAMNPSPTPPGSSSGGGGLYGTGSGAGALVVPLVGAIVAAVLML
ncbi:hypothetical protein QBC34DRAFT_440500 [Podospora aff. communis PSN243]|uniref:Phytocyanin domain-containing protein n=1 Tax=Podospora aff. communis PSN243 TaxID=3040156 RepID=A0AAV9GFU8_9PEZI|nr:hypothetical protein QBC34DRAFT_440500 [Podospora aff. communis PSN243]